MACDWRRTLTLPGSAKVSALDRLWAGQVGELDSRRLVFRDDGIGSLEATSSPDSTGAFQLSARVTAGRIRYHFEMGTRTGGRETILHTATNVVCGDAYLIQGQSNAVATDWGKEEPDFHSPWVRTYGTMSGDPNGLRLWGEAVRQARQTIRRLHREKPDARIVVMGCYATRAPEEVRQLPGVVEVVTDKRTGRSSAGNLQAS